MRKNGVNSGESHCWRSYLGTARFWIESVDYGYDDISYICRSESHLTFDTSVPYVSMGNTNFEDLILILFNEKNRC